MAIHGFPNVFDLKLVTSADVKLRNGETNCILNEKNRHISGPMYFKPMLFKLYLPTYMCPPSTVSTLFLMF